MRVLRSFFMVILLLTPVPVLAYDVLVLQSLHEKGYQEAVKGLLRECRASMRILVLSDYAETDITRIVREERPRLVIAVGDRALQLSEKLKNIPVLYMMALNPRPRRNVSGIGMLIEPARYLEVFQALGAKRVGVVYDPARSGDYLKRAQEAARRSGIDLVVREVHAPKETPAMLETLRGKVDALWMLPDPTAVSPASVEAYFLFSQSERVPVVSFAEAYLSVGGAVALSIDRYDIGRQLGEMVNLVLQGRSSEGGAYQAPRRVLNKANNGVLRHLKITFGMAEP